MKIQYLKNFHCVCEKQDIHNRKKKMEMFYILEGLVKGMLYRNAEVQVCSFGEQYKFSFNVCPTTKLDIHEGSPSHTETHTRLMEISC